MSPWSRTKAGLALVAGLVAGCATAPAKYDPQASESIGRIVAKRVVGSRVQARADSFNLGPAFAATMGGAGLVLGDAMQAKTAVSLYEYRIRTEDGRDVPVVSDYFAHHVGECVKLFESKQPGYPRLISHGGCS